MNNLAKLTNLEFLDLGSNNFSTIPDVLTKENFPKLRALILNANQRSTIYDLSNTQKTNLGGFIEEKEFPKDLILWGLDTLVLSVNYLQGELPDFLDDESVPVYTEEDRIKGDTLPEFLVKNKIKKVMPHTKRFSINFNRLTGKLPDWLLYHPSLDIWIPYSLVFQQEGYDQQGNMAKFDNEPANLDYYYQLYPFKKQYTGEEEEVE
jgi:Leucine-rich repeat (LRR) protein